MAFHDMPMHLLHIKCASFYQNINHLLIRGLTAATFPSLFITFLAGVQIYRFENLFLRNERLLDNIYDDSWQNFHLGIMNGLLFMLFQKCSYHVLLFQKK